MTTIWVAYSGGVDSHVLLHLAVKSGYQVQAIHINDQLSPNSDKWQQHCENTCADLKVKLICIKVDATPKPKQSHEDAARIARRNAWAKVVHANDVLMLAHHANDQAETILYRLFRGSGPHGLSGMEMYSKLGKATIFRPFLEVNKQAILAYAKQHKLNYCQDETNRHTKFDRNFIRHKIIPLTQKRWPALIENIARAGQLNANLLHLLQPLTAQKLESCSEQNYQILNIYALKQQSTLWQVEILRAWLIKHDLYPSVDQLQHIQQQVIDAKHDAQPKYLLADKIIRRSNDCLYIFAEEPRQFHFETEWDMQADLILPNGRVLKVNDYAELKSQRIVVKLGIYGHKAKKIFQQHGIPPWQRSGYPLLFAGGKLIRVIGLNFS